MNNSQIVLHRGAQEVSLDQLAAAPTPNPTKSWTPIPHIALLEQVKDSLGRTGYTTTREVHALNKEQYFGLMDLKSTYTDYTTTIGLRNSHDQTFPAGLVIGNRVFVCDNLAFSAEIKFSRKHTTNIARDLPQLIDSSIGKIADYVVTQDQRVQRYKETEISVPQFDHILMNVLRDKILPVTSVVNVMNEFEHPKHPEFAKEGYTLWRMYNACTEFMKNSLWMLPKRTYALHAILDAVN